VVERWSFAEWGEANAVLYRRARGNCERCSRPLGGDAARHHRMRRAVGGDRLSNLLLLHTECHRYVHAHPEESRANGWIVAATGQLDPLTAPVRIAGRLWLLDDAGHREVAA
jgi:hypothetical protein